MSSSNSPILAIDVGNSRIKCGLLERPPCAQPAGLSDSLYISSLRLDAGIPWNDILNCSHIGNLPDIDAVIAGSNLTAMRRIVADWPKNGPRTPLVIEDSSRFPLKIDLPHPRQVGIDRLLNAVAANCIRPEGTAAIIVDCGTATTVDLVTTDGAFAGGAILPGLSLSARALHQYTDRLPLVDVDTLADSPPAALGRDTRQAIGSGLYWGQVGGVKELVSRLGKLQPQPLVILTGGGGAALQEHFPAAIYEPHLTLQGLALVATQLLP